MLYEIFFEICCTIENVVFILNITILFLKLKVINKLLCEAWGIVKQN